MRTPPRTLLALLALAACEAGTVIGDPDAVCEPVDDRVDCNDPACANEIECTWPVTLTLDGRFDYTPNSLAQVGGARACTIEYTSRQELLDDDNCVDCDRAYHGTHVYLTDSCPPEIERPDRGSYGLVFASDTRWGAYFREPGGAWTSMGDAHHDGDASYVLTRTDPLIVDGYDLGDVDTTYTFTPD